MSRRFLRQKWNDGVDDLQSNQSGAKNVLNRIFASSKQFTFHNYILQFFPEAIFQTVNLEEEIICAYSINSIQSPRKHV